MRAIPLANTVSGSGIPHAYQPTLSALLELATCEAKERWSGRPVNTNPAG